ncbi:hypothetical protein [Desulfosporosinus sp. SB140]|uniref:hypothetical protein n=1 Tax=Desulfosporosinus paludis TaxID=3115649 RepID=UPI003890802B
MFSTTVKRRKRLVIAGIISFLIIAAVLARLASSYKSMTWQDLSDTDSSTPAPTINIDQIVISLKDILKQYEALVTSSKQTNRSEMIANLDKLYQLALNDDVNANALNNSSSNNQKLNDLAQATTFLTSSIFEMKDSLLNVGDFSQTQLQSSREDLVTAIHAIERVQQE